MSACMQPWLVRSHFTVCESVLCVLKQAQQWMVMSWPSPDQHQPMRIKSHSHAASHMTVMTMMPLTTAVMSVLAESCKQRQMLHQHHHHYHQADCLRHHLHNSPCKIWYISSAGAQALQVGLGLCVRACMRVSVCLCVCMCVPACGKQVLSRIV